MPLTRASNARMYENIAIFDQCLAVSRKWYNTEPKLLLKSSPKAGARPGELACDVYVGGKVRVLEFITFSYLEHHGSK